VEAGSSVARFGFLKYNLTMKKQLLSLLKKEAFFKKKIVLASGKTSNYYIDVRRVSLSPQGIYLISHLIFKLIKDKPIQAIGGPTMGADPIVGGVCLLAAENKRKLKGFLIRKSPKKHGRQKLIEGQELKPGMKAVVVDDVATSGGSLIKSITVLREAKVKVFLAVTVVDRQEGASENLKKYNC